MALNHTDTELLYDRLAAAIDKARTFGDPAEMEALLLAKLSFVALRDLGDGARAQELIDMALQDLVRADP